MREKGYHIALATTIFAILLWGSVKLGGQYQSTVQVPVSLLNTPPRLAPVFPIPRSLELTFRGEGWPMVGHLWNSDLLVELDARVVSGGVRVLTLRDIQRVLAAPEGIELIDMKPESLTIAFDVSVEKRVPVVLENRASFAEGYGLSGIPLVVPDSITVGGTASVIQLLESWYVVTPPMEDLKSAVEQTIPLSDSSFYLLTFSPSTVTLVLNVQPLAEKVLSGIPITVHSVPPDREVILIPPRIEVLVRGAIDRLSQITVADCRVSVDFLDIAGDTVRTAVPVIELPEGLTAIGKTPERLQFVIRKRL